MARHLVFAVLVIMSMSAKAEVRLHAMFADHMVLQMGRGTPVYGTANPGERVVVRLGSLAPRETQADARGEWRVGIDLDQPGGPYELTVDGSSGKVTVQDVLVGDVWICSGQSNMAMSVDLAIDGAKEVAEADYPNIRLFYVDEKASLEPTSEITVNWRVCTPESAAKFSAVGYFFGRDVHRDIKIPIGLINPNWGGTPAQSWTPREALASNPELKHYAADIDRVRADSQRSNVEPTTQAASLTPGTPTVLYNGMIHPIQPFGIKGVVWYQGESNADRAAEYRMLYPALIASWRQTWGRGDFPFYHVQLANYRERKTTPDESEWAELREAQSFASLNVPNCDQAVAIDVGDAKDIHPRNKQAVGNRLARIALAKTYGREIEYSGPILESMQVDGDVVHLKFSHVGSGLTAKSAGALGGFSIAGVDGKFVWADAKIVGKDTVVVSNTQIASPKAVRYAWADNPEVSLYNDADLPASPFRTDSPIKELQPR